MQKLFIISNESIYEDKKRYFCENIDLKSTPEELRLKISNLFKGIGFDPNFEKAKLKIEFMPIDIGYEKIPEFLKTLRLKYLPLAREAGIID